MTNKQNLITEVKQSLAILEKTEGAARDAELKYLQSKSLYWLQQLVTELEEVQKKHDAIIQALNDCRDTPGFVFAADVFDWLESTSPFLKEGL